MQFKKSVLALAVFALASTSAQAATYASDNMNHTFGDAMWVPDGFFTDFAWDVIQDQNPGFTKDATVVAYSSGPFDYYTFNTYSTGSIILDVGFTYRWPGNAGSFDPEVALWMADGTLLGENDDLGSIDAGSVHEWDSYLKIDNLAAGTYVAGVARYQATAVDGGWSASSAEIPDGGRYTLHIITAVPEAESWAMLLAGLGLVGSVIRRRAV